jgi:hypothetical protein
VQQCNALNKLATLFPDYQQQYVGDVSRQLKIKVGEAYQLYQDFTASDVYSLGDNGRQQRIGKCVQILEDGYAFVVRFRINTQKLLLQEAKENNDVNNLYKISQP